MKTLRLTSAWILICSISAVSSGSSEHTSSHHVVQHGTSTAQKTPPDTAVPFGVQMPDHVLSHQNVSCISADDNIFQIMHEAQNVCSGDDMRCTFYHFVNHEYENIGTLDVNKELFDDLLMKFDNWLLTPETIGNAQANGKTNAYSNINTNSIHEYEGRVVNRIDTIESNSVHTYQGNNEHHNNNPEETHHRNHHHKLKNGNHIKTEFNKEHRYFEVFLPKDEVTGKPRTIYVEIDKDKNEFVLVDEDIDKKLNGVKPIKIELDELSEIADAAFGNLVKPTKKGHIHNNINNHVMASDLNTHSAVDKSELYFKVGKDESTQNVHDSHVYNINANQQFILNNGMENVKNALNVSKNLIVPNKYTNQDQFHVESHIDHITEDIDNHFEILPNINETDTHETGFYEKEYFDSYEFDHSNITDIDLDTDYLEVNSSHEITGENEYDNYTEHDEYAVDHDIVTYDDNDFIELDEHNDTNNVDYDYTHEFLPTDIIDINENILENVPPVQKTNLNTTPYEHKLVSSLTDRAIDYANSHFHSLPPDNQKAQIDQHEYFSMSNIPICPFTATQILGKDLTKAVKTDSYLQSPFPVHATADLAESDSHIPIFTSELHPAVSSQDYILPLPNTKFSGSPKYISPDLYNPTKDSSLFNILPSYNIDVKNPCFSTVPIQLETNTPISTKNNILPSQFALPKSIGDFDKLASSHQFYESPSSVTPYSLQQIPTSFLPTKDNVQWMKHSLPDTDIKEAKTPCPSNRNPCSCNTIPYTLSPYLKSPQLTPSYFEPPLHVSPLQPIPKVPALGSLPISLDQSNLWLNADYPQETKPIPLLPYAPKTPLLPLNPQWLEPGSFSNTYPNIYNNIPYQMVPSLPYTSLPAQNIWNNPPINYFTPNIYQQQNQIPKPLPTKEVPKSVLPPCATKNILQMIPSNNAPFFAAPIQIDSNPSLSLERDLQTLSCKYGIPFTKILDALDAEISSTDSQTSWIPYELPRSKFVHDNSLKVKSTSSATAVVEENETGNKHLLESDLTNLTPLDSSLIGPHLEIDNSLLLGTNDIQPYTVASETIESQSNQYFNLDKHPDNKFQDRFSIGSQLETLATSNIQLREEDLISHADSFLKGPHLELVSPPVMLDSNSFKNAILTSYTEVPVTSTSEIKTKLNQDHVVELSSDELSLDTSLIGLQLNTVSPAKSSLSDEIQITNEVIPLESDLTELTILDSQHVDVINDLKQSEIIHSENTTATIDNTVLYEPIETELKYIEGNLLSEADSSKLIPLDTTLIGPHLQTGNLPIITNATEDKSVSLNTHETIANTDIKSDEIESIILPSSMLSTLLNKPVNAHLNLTTKSDNTKLNKELNNLSLETNSEQPITEISSTSLSLNETEFQIIEPSHEISDFTILEDKLKSPDITLDVKSETQLDTSLIGPNLQQETNSIYEISDLEMSPMLDSVDHLETYEELPISNLNQKLSKISSNIDSKIQYDSSLIGPSLIQEMKALDTSTVLDSIIELDDSFVHPDLHETIESSVTSTLSEATNQVHSSKGTLKLGLEKIDEYHTFDYNNVLDTSLVGPHLLSDAFSNDEIKMINKELQVHSELANLIPLDTSLIGPHLDFESPLHESEISLYHHPESSIVKGGSSLKPIDMPSDLQELLSKFTNAITKSHLSPYEMKPCNKLLSSFTNIAADNNYIELPYEHLQEELASEYYPINMITEEGISPAEYNRKEKLYYNSNDFPVPITYPEYVYAKEVPQLPITSLINHNWLGQPPYIQHIHQASPGVRPVMENAPFTSEDFHLLSDLASQNKLYPQPSYFNTYTPGETISSSPEWISPCNSFPVSNYIPLLPKKSVPVHPCNLESTVSNSEYTPTLVDDIMSLIDEDTHQLRKNMYILPPTTPTIPMFKGEIVSPSLLDTIPITNTDFMKPRPCHSHPYSLKPIGAQFSEPIGPPPKLISLPTETPKVIEPQWYNIPNKPQFIESVENPILYKKDIPQSYLDSPIYLPSSALDTMLQMPTASNKLNSIPCQLAPVNFSPMQTPLTNVVTTSILPNYAKPLSVSYVKPTLTPITTLPLNLPLPASPVSPTLSLNPYKTSSIIPEFSSPLIPINIEPLDYQYLPTLPSSRPISAIPYKPSQTYSSPCLPVHTTPLSFDTSSYPQAFQSKVTSAMTTPCPLEYIKPVLAPYLSPVPKSLTKLEIPVYSAPLTPIPYSPLEPMPISLVSPSYVSPITQSSVSTNVMNRPSNIISPAYVSPITPISSKPISNLIILPSEPMSIQNPQIIKPKPQLMKPMNTIPISFDNNPFSNAYEILPISPNIPKSLPCLNSQIIQNIPYGEIIKPNLQTPFLLNELPVCTYTNDKANNYYKPNQKYPLESMSYTLAPEHITETLSAAEFVNQEHLIPVLPITSVTPELLKKTNVYPKPCLTNYTPLYVKPEIAKQHVPPPHLTEVIFNNVLPMPPIKPYPVLLPTPIQSSQVLKPLTPVTAPASLSLLPSPSVIPYNIVPIKQEPLLALPNYSENLTPIAPITLPKLQPPTWPNILDNYFELPPTHYESQSKTLAPKRPLVKSLPMPSYKQYVSPIIPPILPIVETSPPLYVTPLSLLKNEKLLRPLSTPQYISPLLPVPTKLQEAIPLTEVPIHYHTPAVLPSSVKSTFVPPVTAPYTVLPLSDNIIQPLRTELKKPKWSTLSPQYTLPVSISSPILLPSSTVPLPTILPVTAPPISKPAFTNHIIPSSLFMVSDVQVPTSKVIPHYHIPKYSLPSPNFISPIETVPYEIPSRPLETTVLPQNILKPIRQFSNGQSKVVPPSPYLTQPLELTDYYPAQPCPNIQYTAKTLPKLSPVLSFSALPLETTPYQLVNELSIPQYTLPHLPVCDASKQPLPGKNPFSNPNFKPILEVPAYPVPNKLMSSPKITPFDSILLSNLQPIDIRQESRDSYSSPTVPLYSLPIPKSLPQQSHQYQPQITPNYSQYISQLPIENIPEVLPSTSPLLKRPILKPSTINYECSNTFTPLVSEIPETVVPINLPTTPSSLLKSKLNKYNQLPVSIANNYDIANYDIVEPSPNLPIKTNKINKIQPVDVAAISVSELSPLSQYPLDSEMIEEIKSYEYMKEPYPPTEKLSSIPTYQNLQQKFHPALYKYLTMPQLLQNAVPLSKYKNLKPAPPLLEIPEEVELIDTTDFIPLAQIKSGPSVVDYIPTDKQAPILKNIPPKEPDISQFSPYTLLNTDFPPSKYKQLLTKLQTPSNRNQLSLNSPVYLSPQEYKDLVQGPSISKGSSSSSANVITSAYTEPPMTNRPMTVETRSGSLYTSPVSFIPENWLEPPISAKPLLPHEIPVEVAPETENIQTFVNKYTLYNKISPVCNNNYPYEVLPEVPLKVDTLKPIPLRKSGLDTEYEVLELNDFNEYDSEMIPYELEPKNIEVRGNKPIDTKLFTEISPEIFEGLTVPPCYETHTPEKLSKLDHFFANNHIGKSPPVFTTPTYKSLPIGPPADITCTCNESPDISNDFTIIPTEYVSKLESSSFKPCEYQPLPHSHKNIPIMNPINYLYPCLKPYSQSEFPPNAIELTNISEMPYEPISYAPHDNTEDIKYSGYKTYQMPLMKSQKLTQNLATPIQEYEPCVVPYSPPIHSIKPINVQKIAEPCHFYSPVEMSELDSQYLTPIEIKKPLRTQLDLDTIKEIPELEEYGALIPQYQNLVDMETPFDTNLEFNTFNESLEFDEYNSTENLQVCAHNENEDNELKTSLLNYINKRDDVKNNLYNSNAELTIPIGNIAITKKEPYNANTIKTNNPLIGLKIWKSNVKIAQAELKLKFKDLSVHNFMPIVNSLDEYDMEEIRRIVKNYIDDKYGAHIEVNEPYTVDNKYAVIKDFNHNTVDNKYNLLWPTNYV